MQKHFRYALRKKAGQRLASFAIGLVFFCGFAVITGSSAQASEVQNQPVAVSASDTPVSSITEPASTSAIPNSVPNLVSESSSSTSVASSSSTSEATNTVTVPPTSAVTENNLTNNNLAPVQDRDHDGIVDSFDKHPDQWDVSDRDLRFFTELSYRDENELNLIFGGNQVAIAAFSHNKLLDVANVSEVVNDWQLARQFNNTKDGFSATIFTNKDQAVVAFRGTNDRLDAIADSAIFSGTQPNQVKNFDQVLAALNPFQSIFLTGHSLGGYLAEYFAATKLMYDPRFIHGAVFNAPGIRDAWSWISGNLTHRMAATNSTILSRTSYINDADLSNPVYEAKMQSFAIHDDAVGGLFYYPNTKWAYAVNNRGTHSSSNFFAQRYSSEIANWFTTGYRMDTPVGLLDDDNDGFSNQLEAMIGSDRHDAISQPHHLNQIYQVAVKGKITATSLATLSKNDLINQIDISLTNQFAPYMKYLPKTSTIRYEFINYPPQLTPDTTNFNMKVVVLYPDGSRSTILTVPVEFTQAANFMALKNRMKSAVAQMNLTAIQIDQLNKMINQATTRTDLGQVTAQILAWR